MDPIFSGAIAVHATAATVALILGLGLAIAPRTARHPWLHLTWFGLLALAVAMLAVAVAVGWGAMDPPRRWMDVGLLVLAAYTLFRGVQAVLVVRAAPAGWSARFLDHLGFTAISLFDGFVIVAAIRAGLPAWAVIGVGVLGVVGGIAGIELLKRRPSVRTA